MKMNSNSLTIVFNPVFIISTSTESTGNFINASIQIVTGWVGEQDWRPSLSSVNILAPATFRPNRQCDYSLEFERKKCCFF